MLLAKKIVMNTNCYYNNSEAINTRNSLCSTSLEKCATDRQQHFDISNHPLRNLMAWQVREGEGPSVSLSGATQFPPHFIKNGRRHQRLWVSIINPSLVAVVNVVPLQGRWPFCQKFGLAVWWSCCSARNSPTSVFHNIVGVETHAHGHKPALTLSCWAKHNPWLTLIHQLAPAHAQRLHDHSQMMVLASSFIFQLISVDSDFLNRVTSQKLCSARVECHEWNSNNFQLWLQSFILKRHG